MIFTDSASMNEDEVEESLGNQQVSFLLIMLDSQVITCRRIYLRE